MKRFEQLVIGELFQRHEVYKWGAPRTYRKLTDKMAACLLTGHRFFLGAETICIHAEYAPLASPRGLAQAFGVDAQTAVAVTAYLVEVGDRMAQHEASINQAAFFGMPELVTEPPVQPTLFDFLQAKDLLERNLAP